ncbi:MAG: sulfite exporter TauE/SafE family protein [Peptococcaceae bacterium]|nr:sulfite exporter TauE/SafE family protein [Peptococcaceae bacterium]
MIGIWLEQLAGFIGQSGWLGPLLAFAAGILTSVSPCSLSMLPLVIGYVGGGDAVGRRAFGLSATFALGTAITLTALGAVAALAGKMLSGIGTWWYLVAGVLMILMALQIWEVYTFIQPSALLGKTRARGYAGALVAGLLGGLFASSCATPVLMALLTVVVSQDSIQWGVVLLFCYALGNGLLIVVLGTCFGAVQQMKQNPRYAAFSQISRTILGLLVLLLGLWFFYLGF